MPKERERESNTKNKKTLGQWAKFLSYIPVPSRYRSQDHKVSEFFLSKNWKCQNLNVLELGIGFFDTAPSLVQIMMNFYFYNSDTFLIPTIPILKLFFFILTLSDRVGQLFMS